MCMWCFKSFKMLFFGIICASTAIVASTGQAEVVYTFTSLDYDWPKDSVKATAVKNGEYIVENNIITGIKVHRDSVYVTVPRWKPGVPATLNKLVTRDSNTTVLQPFPSWPLNTIGNCGSLQYVQSMEVDPNTGYMWIIDTGRVNTRTLPLDPKNLCPAKIIVLNIDTKKIIRRFIFPPDVASPSSNFLNDIVLDYVDGKVKYAYITDTSDAKIYVYDYDGDSAYFFEHESMKRQPLIPGVQNGLVAAPTDGIAISSDFKYVYYCTLSSLHLYAIPTEVLRKNGSDFSKSLIFVGNKTGGSDGMAFGQSALFYASLEQNAVYSAKVGSNGLISLSNQRRLIADDNSVVWVDTFAWNRTYLWFTANKLTKFFSGQMNFTGNDDNMFIWKMEVGEKSYLDGAKLRTRVTSDVTSIKAISISFCIIRMFIVIGIKFLI